MKKLLLTASLIAACAVEMCAESAIYACGHIRRQRPNTIETLRNSGYTTVILFNVNVENDGSLTTDFSWSSQTAAEAGGIICRDGEYTFDRYQPEYISDIKSILEQPTSVQRLEICIGGWGNGSYGHIRDFIKAHGTDENTMLYRNFKALKEAIPEIEAVNNDQEQDYDLETAIKFHSMLAKIGYKTTVAPYMNRNYWRDLVSALNTEAPGTCDMVYLQTYGGGANNNPNDWKVFGDIPMLVGFDCEANGNMTTMENQFKNWRDKCGVVGGFLWNYNSEARVQGDWATAINRIFHKPEGTPVATFHADTNYLGYSVGLPVGSYTLGEMARLGIKPKDIASVKVEPGYKVTLYQGGNFDGTSMTVTESKNTLSRFNNRTCSIVIEPDGQGAAEAPIADADSYPANYFNLQGQHIEAPAPGTLCIRVSGAKATKIFIR